MKRCGVCGRNRQPGKIIKLSDGEARELHQSGIDPRQEYVYCRPCWRTLSNRETGFPLGKGLIIARLRQLGIPHAGFLADTYFKKLQDRIDDKKAN